ncbi:MAG TPA: TonB family protein [Steroidobacteraceae bacterium]|nr:TonB family protein [Steroidobacteraceae bacterium]
MPAAEPTRMARPRRVEVIVLGNDEFLIEIGPLLGDGFRTVPVDSPASVAGILAEKAEGGDAPPTLIMLDASAVPDARGAVAQLESAHPNLPVVVIAETRDESHWGAAIARGAIIDVVARYDLNSDKFRDALSRAETRARNVPKSPPPGGSVTAPAKSNNTMIIAAAVAVALGVGGYFVMHKSSGPATNAGPVAQTADSAQNAAAAKPMSTLELLSAARIAFRDQKLLPRSDGEPRGDSALELYAQVLAQEPKNDEAIDGLQRLFSVVKSRVQADLTANKLDDAQKMLASYKSTGVNADGVRDLDATIAAARPKFYAAKVQEALAANDFTAADQYISALAPFDRAKAAELTRTLDARRTEMQTTQQLSALSSQVKSAIESGNLIDPANDNARTRLNAMRQISRSHPLTMGAQKDLQSAMIARAQEQGAKDQFDAANKWLAAAAEVAATPEVAEAKKQLQSQIESTQRAAASAAAAKKAAEQQAQQAAMTSSAPAASASAAAASAAPAQQSFIAARPTTPIRLSYPSSAGDRSGFVIVDFVLQLDGRPTQPTVVESTPPKVFDQAAIDAVMSGKFDTSKLTDKQPKHARVRLSFKPN